MRLRAPSWLIVRLGMLIAAGDAVGQGSFQNLDFEHPALPLMPVDFQVPITKALPGWTGYIGGVQVDYVIYNTISIGSSEIDLQGPGSLEPILEGSYTLGMGPSTQGLPTAIAQVGIVPSSAKSLSFYVYDDSAFTVTFWGTQIPVSVVGSTSTARILGGDISAFAGQTGELRFQGGGELDFIQFSDQAVPEPGVFGLWALGMVLVGWRVLGRRR